MKRARSAKWNRSWGGGQRKLADRPRPCGGRVQWPEAMRPDFAQQNQQGRRPRARRAIAEGDVASRRGSLRGRPSPLETKVLSPQRRVFRGRFLRWWIHRRRLFGCRLDAGDHAGAFGGGAEFGRGGVFQDKFAQGCIDIEDFKEGRATFVAGVLAFFAAFAVEKALASHLLGVRPSSCNSSSDG